MNCRAHHYLARPPEQLVVGGYRHWLSGCATGSVRHWNAAREMYVARLGNGNGRIALTAMSDFVGTLGRCAACPLRFFPSQTDCVCRDECLVLGLIAGIQNGDEEAQLLCLAPLACRFRHDEVMAQAGEFAILLKSFGQSLLPIPAHAITDIVMRAAAAAHEPDNQPTYH